MKHSIEFPVNSYRRLVTLATSVQFSEYTEIRKAAQKRKIPISEFLRQALRYYLENQGEI